MRQGIAAHHARLWRYCVALTGRRDWADDLVQAACLRALEKAAQYQSGTHVDRWLFRIAQTTWLNELRRRKVRFGGGLVAVEDVDLPSGQPDTETNILARQVLNHITRLPEAQRLTVFLVYVEGFSYADAAAQLDIPIGTVMSRLATARRTLNAKLEGTKP
ncbi:MAG: RNA polymerase sigma factor [Pseudomonadota bacterium]